MLVDATGKTKTQIEKDSDRDYWMTSDEAKKYGIVDQVLKPKASK
jgi:ATP-dependent Clp protease protease subunit